MDYMIYQWMERMEAKMDAVLKVAYPEEEKPKSKLGKR